MLSLVVHGSPDTAACLESAMAKSPTWLKAESRRLKTESLMHLSLRACEVRSWQMGDMASLVTHANNRKIWINLRDGFPHPYTHADGRAFIRASRKAEPESSFAIAVGGVGRGPASGEDDRGQEAGDEGCWAQSADTSEHEDGSLSVGPGSLGERDLMGTAAANGRHWRGIQVNLMRTRTRPTCRPPARAAHPSGLPGSP